MKSSGKAMHQKRRVISTLHSIKIVTEDVRPCTESALSWPLPTLLDTHHWGVQSQWHPFWSNPVDMCIWCHNFFFLLSFLLKYFLFFFFLWVGWSKCIEQNDAYSHIHSFSHSHFSRIDANGVHISWLLWLKLSAQAVMQLCNNITYYLIIYV